MSDRIAVMSAGKILQVGTPRDIYDRPAERFVADFIGESNFLPASIVSTAGSLATVRLASGAEIPASLPDGFAPNGKVNIVIRPEHAQLTHKAEGTPLAGALENIVYLGTDTHFHLRLDSGEPFIVRRQNTRGHIERFAQGERVGVLIPADAAQILRD